MSISAAEGELTALFRALCHLFCAPSLDTFFFLFTLVWSDVSFSAHLLLNFIPKSVRLLLAFLLLSRKKTKELMTYLLNLYYLTQSGFP